MTKLNKRREEGMLKKIKEEIMEVKDGGKRKNDIARLEEHEKRKRKGRRPKSQTERK